MKTKRYFMKLTVAFLFCVGILAVFKSANVFHVDELFRERSKHQFHTSLLKEQKHEIVQDTKAHINLKEQPQDCSPHRYFAYIKTHKTGSTAVYKILRRYATKHALNAVVKAPHPYIGGYPGHVKEEFLFLPGKDIADTAYLRPVQRGEHFVLLNHFRFNYTLLRTIMPRKTLFVSVVRKPWRNFQSTFYFYYQNPNPTSLGRVSCFSYPFFHVAQGRHVSISDYISLASEELDPSVPWFFRSKNFQSFDLGLDPLLENENEIKKAVEKLASQIDLMMITDYMEESMILLKDLFCMSWSDILFVDDGSNHRYIPQVFDDNTKTMKQFNQMYKLDLMMYEHFNKTLWKKVDAYGRERMEEDMQKLRTFRNQLKAKNKTQQTKFKPRNLHTQQLASVDEVNHRMFELLRKNYKNSFLRNILTKKIRYQGLRLNNEQEKAIANYMFQNKGSCPM